MANGWLQNLLADRRPDELPPMLLNTKKPPKWVDGTLEVTLRPQHGLEGAIGKIYPGVQILVREADDEGKVVIRLHHEDARHYAEKFTQEYPNKPIERRFTKIPPRLVRPLALLTTEILESSAQNGAALVRAKITDTPQSRQACEALQQEYPSLITVNHDEHVSRHVENLPFSVTLKGVAAEVYLKEHQKTHAPETSRGGGHSR